MPGDRLGPKIRSHAGEATKLITKGFKDVSGTSMHLHVTRFMYTTGHAALVTRNSRCRNTCSFRQYRPVPARVENAYIPLINTLISLVQTSLPSPCEDDGPSDTSPSTQAHSSAGCREKRKMVRFQRTPRRIRFTYVGLANSCQICSPPFDPSIWNAAVAVPHSNPSGNWRTFMRGVLRLPGKLKRTNASWPGAQ